MSHPVVVHTHLDLDAVACVAAAGAPSWELHFWPSQRSFSAGEKCPCCNQTVREDWRVLDHPAGEKGRLDPDGTRHAALLSMPEAAGWDPDLLAEVDEQDSTGRVRQPRFSLAAILAALRRNGYNDRVIASFMVPILNGLNLLYQDRQEAERIADGLAAVCGNGWRLALLPEGSTSPMLGMVLAERGFAGAIYQDGLNLGVTRYPQYSEPDLRKLQPHLPGWFIHSAGFLAAWDSRKAPASGPPPDGTPRNQSELARLCLEVLNR